jgi:hypothetical protein
MVSIKPAALSKCWWALQRGSASWQGSRGQMTT